MLDGVLNESSVEKLNWIEQAIPDQSSGFFTLLNPKGKNRKGNLTGGDNSMVFYLIFMCMVCMVLS